MWNVTSHQKLPPTFNSTAAAVVGTAAATCSTFSSICSKHDHTCFKESHSYSYLNPMNMTAFESVPLRFSDLNDFSSTCFEATCLTYDFTHQTIVFNTFLFAQIFNEYNSRRIFDEVNVFSGLGDNFFFPVVSVISVCAQIFFVQIGNDVGRAVGTTPLTSYQWLITVGLAAISIPLGFLMRFIPVKEDPNSFAEDKFKSSLA